MSQGKRTIRDYLPILVGALLMIILIVIPTGYEDAVIYGESERCRVQVLDTDESRVIHAGIVQTGEQVCSLEILNGKFKGEIVSGVNFLSGSMENDKIYEQGDRALAVISYGAEGITSVTMTDHYRLDKEILLAVLFFGMLVVFAGGKGFYAIMSFVITILAVWKLLVPSYLQGHNPIYMGLLITVLLTVVIIFLVYGWDRRTICAVGGSLLGTLTTCVLGILFTGAFKVHGAVMPYSESLLYCGYLHLNLTSIFMSSIFIGASGAMMDLSVDITSAVYEVICKKPDIGWKEAAWSGMNVGRAAMGTMTTTLLLAYSGGYVSLLMVFMAQGTPVEHIFNYKYVASELLDTMIGSFGLVTVAPFTSFVSGLLLTHKKENVTREHTLAGGGPYCDCHYKKK